MILSHIFYCKNMLNLIYISGDQCWAVSGSSSGVLTCWDLRFLLPVVKSVHPAESRVRSLFIPQRYTSKHSNLESLRRKFQALLFYVKRLLSKALIIFWLLLPLLIHRSLYSGSVLASVQGNNEVGLWNLESQFRQLVLWASSSPLLVKILCVKQNN